nr:glycerol-3-phosphate acyltransferase [Gammaproteobacteria bacterium]
GLLGYIVRSADLQQNRDIVFVPVGINYDRVLEDRTLTRSGRQVDGRISLTLSTLKYLFHNLWLAVTGRWYRNGYACVNFGSPISLREWKASRPDTSSAAAWELQVEEFAGQMMDRVGEVIPILPVALVASVFAHSEEPSLDLLTLKNRVFELIADLETAGRHVYIPRGDLDYAVDVGIRMLVLRHVLKEDDGMLSVAADELTLLNYYAASIEHLVAPLMHTGKETRST